MEKIKSRHLVYLAGVGILFVVLNFTGNFNPFAALNFSSQPLFASLDQFILVGEKIELADNIQVSSGDLAANQKTKIKQNNIINGNLFSDEIRIEATSAINGNAAFNELEIASSSQILGTTSSPISLPIIKLPEILPFSTGNQKLLINQTSTISPGNFDEIEVLENIQLTLNPGIYNLNKLDLTKTQSFYSRLQPPLTLKKI